MTFFKVFFQRLFSTQGQAETKAAYMELGQVLTGGAALYAALRAKDFGVIEAQLPLFATALIAFFTAARGIISSNTKAIANPALPKIVGDGTQPTNVVVTAAKPSSPGVGQAANLYPN
jgi:hypothetical protein